MRRRLASPVARAYASATAQGRRTPWREASFCVVDLETTGLDPRHDEVVSFAALAVDDGRVRLDTALDRIVRPTRPVSVASVRIHGLRRSDLDHAPVIDEVIDELLATLTGRVLVAHATWVERAFLRPVLRRAGVRLRRPLVDTALLGRLWLQLRDGDSPRRLGLARLCEALGLPSHRPHTAMGDALSTAQAFLALATNLEAEGPETVASLARADQRLEQLRLYPQQRC